MWLEILIIGRVLRLRRNPIHSSNASFDSLLYRAGFGHRGKGWIVRGTTTGLTGSSTQPVTGCYDFQLNNSSVADCQALT